MRKIKQKRGWSRYTKPYLPSAPTPPEKKVVVETVKEIGTKPIYRDTRYSVAELPFPDGEDLETVFVELQVETDYSGDADYVLRFYTVDTEERDNPRYKALQRDYEKRLAEWQAQSDGYKQELKEWKAWVKQEEEDDLQRNLRHAEALLKKHGKTVT